MGGAMADANEKHSQKGPLKPTMPPPCGKEAGVALGPPPLP
jgi:hypothetical protein